MLDAEFPVEAAAQALQPALRDFLYGNVMSDHSADFTDLRILCIGLDAADPALLLAMARAGELPALRRLLDSGVWAPLRPPAGFYVSAAWPSFATGLSPLRHGRFAGRQLLPGSDRVDELPNDAVLGTPFWHALSGAGRRVAVVDVPKATPLAGFDGVQLTDWATHDPGQGEGFRCQPTGLARELTEGLPAEPLGACEVHRRGARAFAQLVDALCQRVRAKTELTRRLLDREPWDLLISVFSEPHCIGHQCWHLHDPTHPAHDARLARRLGDPVRTVYRAIDDALAALLAQVDKRTLVVVFSSHGMGPNYSADHLLRSMLRGVLTGRTGNGGAYARLNRLWETFPPPLRAALRPLQQRVRSGLKRTETRRGLCFQVPNNASYSAIRANLAGREPNGRLAAAAGVDALFERLATELPRFENATTGTPVVERVLRVEALWPGRDAHDTLPDFLVQWRQDAPVSALRHPQLGLLRGIYRGPRTGEHREQGLLVMAGPGVVSGEIEAAVDMIDLAPTLSAYLGVELADTDGRVLEMLRKGSTTT